MNIDSIYLSEFCDFWSSNFTTPIPPLPQKPSDLNVTQLEQLRIYDGGKLYQNLFAVTPDSTEERLPADFENNLRNGRVDFQHKDLYRKYGYEHQAQFIEGEMKKYEESKINKAIAESRKRQAAQQKKQQDYANKSYAERLMEEKITPAQIINNQMKYHKRIGNV